MDYIESMQSYFNNFKEHYSNRPELAKELMKVPRNFNAVFDSHKKLMYSLMYQDNGQASLCCYDKDAMIQFLKEKNINIPFDILNDPKKLVNFVKEYVDTKNVLLINDISISEYDRLLNEFKGDDNNDGNGFTYSNDKILIKDLFDFMFEKRVNDYKKVEDDIEIIENDNYKIHSIDARSKAIRIHNNNSLDNDTIDNIEDLLNILTNKNTKSPNQEISILLKGNENNATKIYNLRGTPSHLLKILEFYTSLKNGNKNNFTITDCEYIMASKRYIKTHIMVLGGAHSIEKIKETLYGSNDYTDETLFWFGVCDSKDELYYFSGSRKDILRALSKLNKKDEKEILLIEDINKIVHNIDNIVDNTEDLLNLLREKHSEDPNKEISIILKGKTGNITKRYKLMGTPKYINSILTFYAHYKGYNKNKFTISDCEYIYATKKYAKTHKLFAGLTHSIKEIKKSLYHKNYYTDETLFWFGVCDSKDELYYFTGSRKDILMALKRLNKKDEDENLLIEDIKSIINTIKNKNNPETKNINIISNVKNDLMKLNITEGKTFVNNGDNYKKDIIKHKIHNIINHNEEAELKKIYKKTLTIPHNTEKDLFKKWDIPQDAFLNGYNGRSCAIFIIDNIFYNLKPNTNDWLLAVKDLHQLVYANNFKYNDEPKILECINDYEIKSESNKNNKNIATLPIEDDEYFFVKWGLVDDEEWNDKIYSEKDCLKFLKEVMDKVIRSNREKLVDYISDAIVYIEQIVCAPDEFSVNEEIKIRFESAQKIMQSLIGYYSYYNIGIYDYIADIDILFIKLGIDKNAFIGQGVKLDDRLKIIVDVMENIDESSDEWFETVDSLKKLIFNLNIQDDELPSLFDKLYDLEAKYKGAKYEDLSYYNNLPNKINHLPQEVSQDYFCKKWGIDKIRFLWAGIDKCKYIIKKYIYMLSKIDPNKKQEFIDDCQSFMIADVVSYKGYLDNREFYYIPDTKYGERIISEEELQKNKELLSNKDKYYQKSQKYSFKPYRVFATQVNEMLNRFDNNEIWFNNQKLAQKEENGITNLYKKWNIDRNDFINRPEYYIKNKLQFAKTTYDNKYTTGILDFRDESTKENMDAETKRLKSVISSYPILKKTKDNKIRNKLIFEDLYNIVNIEPGIDNKVKSKLLNEINSYKNDYNNLISKKSVKKINEKSGSDNKEHMSLRYSNLKKIVFTGKNKGKEVEEDNQAVTENLLLSLGISQDSFFAKDSNLTDIIMDKVLLVEYNFVNSIKIIGALRQLIRIHINSNKDEKEKLNDYLDQFQQNIVESVLRELGFENKDFDININYDTNNAYNNKGLKFLNLINKKFDTVKDNVEELQKMIVNLKVVVDSCYFSYGARSTTYIKDTYKTQHLNRQIEKKLESCQITLDKLRAKQNNNNNDMAKKQNSKTKKVSFKK